MITMDHLLCLLIMAVDYRPSKSNVHFLARIFWSWWVFIIYFGSCDLFVCCVIGPEFIILECVPSVKKMFFHAKQALHTSHITRTQFRYFITRDLGCLIWLYRLGVSTKQWFCTSTICIEEGGYKIDRQIFLFRQSHQTRK